MHAASQKRHTLLEQPNDSEMWAKSRAPALAQGGRARHTTMCTRAFSPRPDGLCHRKSATLATSFDLDHAWSQPDNSGSQLNM